jgi:hypothetical protein
MHWIQKKLMRYHHGYFMAVGLGIFLLGFVLQAAFSQEALELSSFQVLTVVGALVLGWGTGRCDQKCSM